MPRIYTEAAYLPDNLLLADTYNKPLQTAIEQLNGQLDGHNLPLQSFYELHVVSPVVTTTTFTKTTGAFNDFYTIIPTSSPAFDIDGMTGEGSVWKSIDQFVIGTNLVAGSINGSACLTIERVTAMNGPGGGGAYTEFGKESTYEVGVFLNDVLIAETGEIGTGIYTVDLPFASEVASKYYVVSVRVKANNRPTSAINDHVPLVVDSRHLWFRNQKR